MAIPQEVERYFQEIKKYPLLSPQEEKELAQKLKRGDKEAKEKFICCNLKLVVSIALDFWRKFPFADLMDLIQEGNSGLLRAVEKFNPDLGFKFSTYATFWINQAISRNLRRNLRISLKLPERLSATRIEKLPERERSEVMKLRKGIESLEELEERLGFNSEEFCFTQEGNSETAQKEIVVEEALKLMEKLLTPRELEVIKLRFGLNSDHRIFTLEDAAKVLALSRERIRQIEKTALNKLKSNPQFRKLAKKYLNTGAPS